MKKPNNMLNKKGLYLIAFLLAMIVFALIIFKTTDVNARKLKKNAGITVGVIIDVTSLKGSPFQVIYSYTTNNSTIYSREPINVDNADLQYLRKVFVGEKLVVVYDTSDHANSKLLLSAGDYNEFEIKPDKAVLQIFKEIDSLRIGKDAVH